MGNKISKFTVSELLNRVLNDTEDKLEVDATNTPIGNTYIGKPTNGDFITAYASGTTITCSVIPFGSINMYDIDTIVQIASDGSVTETYSGDDATITVSSNVITVAGATFSSDDVFVVVTNIPRDKTYVDKDLGGLRNYDQTPLNKQAIDNPAQTDTTNISATTYTGTSDGIDLTGLGQYHLSVTGKYIDADGTLTGYLEVTNDEDSTPGNRDWIKVYGMDNKNDTSANEVSVTNGTKTFAMSFDGLRFKYARWVTTQTGATNTVIVKMKVTPL